MGWNSNKIKVLLYKSGKNYRENIFSEILKTLEWYIPTNTDLYVHIMYSNLWKIFQFLGRLECTSGPGSTLGLIEPCVWISADEEYFKDD